MSLPVSLRVPTNRDEQSWGEDRVGRKNMESPLFLHLCLDKVIKVTILCFIYMKGGNRIGFLAQVYNSPYSIASSRHTFWE